MSCHDGAPRELALRASIKHADKEGPSSAPPNELTMSERRELTELRRKVKRFEMQRETLKKAAARTRVTIIVPDWPPMASWRA